MAKTLNYAKILFTFKDINLYILALEKERRKKQKLIVSIFINYNSFSSSNFRNFSFSLKFSRVSTFPIFSDKKHLRQCCNEAMNQERTFSPGH